MKFLRVIRFDASDDQVFSRAAAPGEWAVSGAFAFLRLGRNDLAGKTRQAFANGFLGLPSFGRSTFATIGAMTPEEHQRVLGWLADHFMAEYGAPDRAEALGAAQEEIRFVLDLCAGKPINTVFAVRRVLDENDAIREEFREVAPPAGELRHARIWDVVGDDA